jgi:hypothetical protein
MTKTPSNIQREHLRLRSKLSQSGLEIKNEEFATTKREEFTKSKHQ